MLYLLVSFFFFNDTPTTEIYTLSLHDALPISRARTVRRWERHVFPNAVIRRSVFRASWPVDSCRAPSQLEPTRRRDRKSTRLNSSHVEISYAVFCLKKKKKKKKNNSHTIKNIR